MIGIQEFRKNERFFVSFRLSGYDSDEEEDEFDELQEKLKSEEALVSFCFIKFLCFSTIVH